MQCVRCGHDKTKVTDTAKLKKCVLRERVCLCCGAVFYTEEKVGADVRQNDMREQLKHFRQFNREKERL